MNIGLWKLAIACLVGVISMYGCKKDDTEARVDAVAEETSSTATDGTEPPEDGASNDDAETGSDPNTEQAEPDEAPGDEERLRPTGPEPSSGGNGSSNNALSFDTRVMLGAEPIPAPFIADLMTRTDIRNVFGFQGELHETDLAGGRRSANYQAVRFAPEDSAFGFSVELWRVDSGLQVARMVRDMRDSWFASEDAGALDTAAIGTSMGIRSLVVGSLQSKFVVLISCSEQFCTPPQLLAMGMLAKNRIESEPARQR